ncbi:MAG: DHH family phosphoesterase [Gammaproteobacteria bacterium]|uniref:DHH family phosphoesterase n=1 Tax=Pseudomaricurvus alcaniphilus TaxID=1166482 RepID=UPI00140C16C1|nr:DHH family phosphoesterase [Pseudomaricurvus alcaniphilus]MBR9912523.1 DHH family phosphoesterase [Gammaproteobacteria bacterium]NHN36304.1 DHH family phosphoesterase [Pseudomaricurvus alcaniphilus]
MADFDVFNGDADGICALLQLRNADPRESKLITGVKRDISLLKQVSAGQGDRVTVLDISMEKNQAALAATLEQGAEVFYVDHHMPGDIPVHANLQAIIDESPQTCTSLLVNKHLDNAFGLWAVTGAFGDNLRQSALDLATELEVAEDLLVKLENLGIYINYNGYGSELQDLHFHPQELFTLLRPYANPLDFMKDGKETFERLETGYHEDMGKAAAMRPETATAKTAVFMLPNEPWCRRVSGVFGNALTNDFPERAHAIITENKDGTFVVSVRAALSNRTGAGELCKQFPSGGGRAAAAGINQLPGDQISAFVDAFTSYYK